MHNYQYLHLYKYIIEDFTRKRFSPKKLALFRVNY